MSDELLIVQVAKTPLEPDKVITSPFARPPLGQAHVGDGADAGLVLELDGQLCDRLYYIDLSSYGQQKTLSDSTNPTLKESEVLSASSPGPSEILSGDLGPGYAPCTALKNAPNTPAAVLQPDAQLGEKVAGALQVNPVDAREARHGGDAAEHAVDVGGGVAPILQAAVAAANWRFWIRHGFELGHFGC